MRVFVSIQQSLHSPLQHWRLALHELTEEEPTGMSDYEEVDDDDNEQA